MSVSQRTDFRVLALILRHVVCYDPEVPATVVDDTKLNRTMEQTVCTAVNPERSYTDCPLTLTVPVVIGRLTLGVVWISILSHIQQARSSRFL